MFDVSVNSSVVDVRRLPFYRELLFLTDILTPIWPSLVLAGLISNTINVVTFVKAGVKDSVATLLLTLSISDAIYLTLMIPTVIYWQVPDSPTTRVVHYLCYWRAMTFYDYSSHISVFLGVTRCACVVKPLHFKSVFTRSRTVIAVILLFCVNALLHIPVLSLNHLRRTTNPLTNTSYLTLVIDPAEQDPLIKINDALNKNAIAGTSFIVMIACAVLLGFKLFQTSKIRLPAASGLGSREHPSPSQDQKQTLSPKDFRVVLTVALVCTIYIVAQLPSFCYSLARVAVDNVNLMWFVGFAIKVSQTCYMTNASINILVYYNCNSTYRATLHSLFSIKDKL